MNTPPIVSAEEWKAAWEQMLVKEKAMTRARDALAAERRRINCACNNVGREDRPGRRAPCPSLV